MNDSKKVAIIIPTYNNVKDTSIATKSAIEAEYDNKIIIIVDDGSKQEIQIKLNKSLKKVSSSLILQLNSLNMGFAATCNAGAEIAFQNNADVLFFLNNDAVVKKDALRYMVEEFKDDSIAIVGPKIYLGKTKLLDSVGGYFDKRTLEIINRGYNLIDDGKFEKREYVEFVSGCAFMVKATVFKVFNGFDEKYYMYSEEIDLCLSVLHAGYKIIYNPKAIVWHEHSKTMGATSNKTLYYLVRNKIYFVKKHGALAQLLLITIISFYKNMASILKQTIRGTIITIWAINDALFNNMGPKKNRWLK